MLSALAALAALVLVILWMAGAFHAKIEPAQVERAVASLAPGQRVAEIHRVTENVVETVIGSIVAERKTTVSSKILATIQSIRVSAGSNVREGDLLIELDARSLSSQVQQARDSLSGAQAGLARAEADFKRMKDLMARNVISQSEYDQSQAAYRVAQAEVARASRAKEETEVALTYSQIRSPISGRVVDRLAEPGDTASPGRPLLTLYDPSALRLEAPVREGLATTLKVGDTLKGRIDALNLEVRGRIDEIVPQAETASRSLLVKVGIPRYPGVYTGLFGRLFIPVGRRQRICIPQAAITRIGQLEYVDVAAKDGTLERRFVQTGEHGEGGNVELLSGAQPGEKVVLKGSSTNSLEQHSRNQTEGD
jgi:RND family efflux transporter MFP subunit